MTEQVRTIEEFERLHYGFRPNYAGQGIAKADTYATSSRTGYFNAIYGSFAWAQLNLEANAFSIIPKYVWDRSGFRVITDEATLNTTNGNTSLGGTAENGKIAELTQPTIAEVTVKPKINQLPFGGSTVFEWLATNSKDDSYGNIPAIRTYMATQHKKNLNKVLMADVENAASNATADYTGTTNWESLDRIISSDAEEDALGGSHDDWYDPWDLLDRDSGSKFDSVVVSPSGTIGTNGTLTNTTIIDALVDVSQKGGKHPNVWLTGHKVYGEIQQIYEPATRYPMGESMVEIDVNGIKTAKGHGVGLQVSSVYGIPLIPTADAPSNSGDTSEVGRMFGIDTSDADGFGTPRMGIMVAMPTSYAEAGRGQPTWPFVNGQFSDKALYWTMGELVCRRFNGNVKIRDIQI